MKNIAFYCRRLLLMAGAGLLTLSASAQQDKKPTFKLKEKNSLRAGTSFAFLTDVDNGGIMYYHQYTRYFSKLFDVSGGIGYLNAQRFDDADKEFTLNKTFVMADVTGYVNFWRSDRFALKIGAGPSFRHRSEIDLIQNGNHSGTNERIYRHTNTSDIGGNAILENNFFPSDRVIFGTRITGHYYDNGTPVLGIGINLGYKF